MGLFDFSLNYKYQKSNWPLKIRGEKSYLAPRLSLNLNLLSVFPISTIKGFTEVLKRFICHFIVKVNDSPYATFDTSCAMSMSLQQICHISQVARQVPHHPHSKKKHPAYNEWNNKIEMRWRSYPYPQRLLQFIPPPFSSHSHLSWSSIKLSSQSLKKGSWNNILHIEIFNSICNPFVHFLHRLMSWCSGSYIKQTHKSQLFHKTKKIQGFERK
jgi:hypothetical protein